MKKSNNKISYQKLKKKTHKSFVERECTHQKKRRMKIKTIKSYLIRKKWVSMFWLQLCKRQLQNNGFLQWKRCKKERKLVFKWVTRFSALIISGASRVYNITNRFLGFWWEQKDEEGYVSHLKGCFNLSHLILFKGWESKTCS